MEKSHPSRITSITFIYDCSLDKNYKIIILMVGEIKIPYLILNAHAPTQECRKVGFWKEFDSLSWGLEHLIFFLDSKGGEYYEVDDHIVFLYLCVSDINDDIRRR